MSSMNDSSDYMDNTSLVQSFNTGMERPDDTSRTEGQQSFNPSLNTISEADLVTGSITDDEALPYDDDGPTTENDSRTYDSRTYDSRTYDSRTYDSRTYDSRTYDSRTYDTRTYDTRTYDDSSFPKSPRSDELSSTFASFYMDGEAARKVKSTLSFLSKPILFLSLALPGFGTVGSFCRVVHAVTAAASRRRVMKNTVTRSSLHALPNGYTDNMPAWMQQARLALPSVVEKLVKRVLHMSGVPSLADLQEERWTRAVDNLKQAKEEICLQAAHMTSGPLVPLVVFFPLFSLTVILVARHLVARRQENHEEKESLLDLEEGMEEEKEEQELDVLPMDGVKKPFSANSIGELPASEANGVSTLVDEEINTGSGGKEPEVREIGDSAAALVTLPGFSHNMFAPSESQTNPHTVPTSRDLSPISSLHEDVVKLRQSPVSDNGVSPSSSGALPPRSLSAAPYALQGYVVAALVGSPSGKEVNVLLVAAARYNCTRVVLPASVSDEILASVPPSLSVARVNDVMEHVMTVEESRELTTVGVFIRPVSDDTIELAAFSHPNAAVYVFVPASEADDELVAHLVDKRICTTPSLDEPIPVNTCFYDRSVKERNGRAL